MFDYLKQTQIFLQMLTSSKFNILNSTNLAVIDNIVKC